MAEARYDAVADFYAAAFDDIDDPATGALLDLLGPPAGSVSAISTPTCPRCPGPARPPLALKRPSSTR
jgi:hypothetical protein